MTEHGETWLAVNSASGSHTEERQHDLLAGLARAGCTPARIVDVAHEDLPDAAALAAAGVGLYVVHGGDGTLNAALARAEGWQGKVLPLPGGTANLLCKTLHGEEADIAAILAALAAGTLSVARRPCIRGHGWIALAEVLAGPGAAWADVRETMRDGAVLDTVSGAIDAAAASTAGPMVALARPALGREEGYAGLRFAPLRQGMRVDGYGASELGDYFKQALAILGRDFRAGPHDELGLHAEAACRMTEPVAIPLMVDGERREGGLEEQFSLAELAVDLFCRLDG